MGAGLHSVSCHGITSHLSYELHKLYAATPISKSIENWRWSRVRAEPVAHEGNDVISTKDIGRTSHGEDVQYHHNMHKGGPNSRTEMQKQDEIQGVLSLLIQVILWRNIHNAKC